ncbi:ANTAR domain-containing protein [Allokutzneria oryzae]|uniref:ANTAR domain-containing protein n=1 Tax=Allokutzneria oryzae TaxID=1378989 RepID=A0ABV5ZXY6_9PSEU
MRASPTQCDDLAIGLQELTTALLSADDVEEALRRITDTVPRLLPRCPMAGVRLERAGKAMTALGSEVEVELAKVIRHSDAQGPGQECMRVEEPVLMADTVTERRWGRYPAELLAHGLRTVYAHPLSVNDRVVGALTLYSRVPGLFDSPTQQTVRMTARHTGVLLGAAIQTTEQTRRAAQLRRALECRAAINQAIGVIMVREGCDKDAAFEILRTTSRSTKRKLAEVALGVVATASGGRPRQGRFHE